MSVPVKNAKDEKDQATQTSEQLVPAQETSLLPIINLRQRVDRLFDEMFTDSPLMHTKPWAFEWPHFPRFPVATGQLMATPRADVSETDKEYLIRAELPGMSEDDLDITISDNVLTLKGEKRSERDEQKEDYHLRECSYGSIRRTFRVPESVNQDKIKAEFENGVLVLTMPKSKKAAPKKVTVKAKGQ